MRALTSSSMSPTPRVWDERRNQVATIKLPNGKELQATTTVANHEGTPPPQAVFTDAATGVSFFAGLAEDPFFLDDTSANRFVASSLQNPGPSEQSHPG